MQLYGQALFSKQINKNKEKPLICYQRGSSQIPFFSFEGLTPFSITALTQAVTNKIKQLINKSIDQCNRVS